MRIVEVVVEVLSALVSLASAVSSLRAVDVLVEVLIALTVAPLTLISAPPLFGFCLCFPVCPISGRLLARSAVERR